jgi:hypothetical protein
MQKLYFERVDSLDDLEEPKEGKIIVPTFVGVYEDFKEDVCEASKNQFYSLLTSGFCESLGQDVLHPNLICLAYDPLTIPADLLNKLTTGDIFNRVKQVRFLELDDIDFSEKPKTQELIQNLRKATFDPTQANISVGHRALEVLKYTKQDYGLNRMEGWILYEGGRIFRKRLGLPEIATDTSEGSFFGSLAVERFIDSLKRNPEE